MAKVVYRIRQDEAAGSRTGEAAGPAYRTAARAFQTAEDILPIAALNGKPAAVVMSPREYDQLSYRSRFVDAVNEGLADVHAGRVVDGDQAVAELLRELEGKPARKPRRR